MKTRIKAIPDMPLYFISEYGDVYTMDGGSKTKYKYPIKLKYHYSNGYKRYSIKGKNYLAHRLVALVFLGRSDAIVNHKDGDKTNNHFANLEYCTSQYNAQHALEMGLIGKIPLENETIDLIEKHLIGTDLDCAAIAKIFSISTGLVKRIQKMM